MITYIEKNEAEENLINHCKEILYDDSALDANWLVDISLFNEFMGFENENTKSELFSIFQSHGGKYLISKLNISTYTFNDGNENHILFEYKDKDKISYFSLTPNIDEGFYFNFYKGLSENYDDFSYTPNNKSYLACADHIYNIIYEVYFDFLTDYASRNSEIDQSVYDELKNNSLFLDFKKNKDFSIIARPYNDAAIDYNNSEDCKYWKEKLELSN